jgi:hypothetical protein
MDSKKVLCCAVLSMILSSCIIFSYDASPSSSYTEWYLKNATNKTLILNLYYKVTSDSIVITQKEDTILDISALSDEDETFDKLWGGEQEILLSSN